MGEKGRFVNIQLVAVGTRMPDWVIAGYSDYIHRLPPGFSVVLDEVPALKRLKHTDLVRVADEEGERVMTLTRPGYQMIALSESGRLWDTQKFSEQLSAWRDLGVGVTFWVGGPEGLSRHCLSRADHIWSLSPLTFPHSLVRVILAEQLYRACTIIQGHPYHR